MAKATKITPKPVKTPPARIVLELSEGEADFILGVTSVIGGDPQKSPRKYSEALHTALREALGYSAFSTDAHKLISAHGRAGSIYFKNYDGSESFPTPTGRAIAPTLRVARRFA
jgi:hypothetical protein